MLRITLIIVALLLFVQLHFKYQLPTLFIYYAMLVNLFTFLLYSVDKFAAQTGRWRIREIYLHLLSLSGGWWGALLAQQFVRHKSIKKPFLVVFTLTLFANIGLIITAAVKDII